MIEKIFAIKIDIAEKVQEFKEGKNKPVNEKLPVKKVGSNVQQKI